LAMPQANLLVYNEWKLCVYCCCCCTCRPTTVPLVDLAALQRRMQQQARARSLGQAAQQFDVAVGGRANGGVCSNQGEAMPGLAAKLRGLLKR
jgi:hypothetical protein